MCSQPTPPMLAALESGATYEWAGRAADRTRACLAGESVATANFPHRILVQHIPYRRDEQIVAPVGLHRLGVDAEGRVLFVDPAHAASRKHVYLPADEPSLVAYVRDDPPAGYSLLDAIGGAFNAPLPRPDALALLGLLTTHHVILADGTRLGAPRDRLATLVARISLEPDGFVQQVARVPDWALTEALRPRLADLRGRLTSSPWVRGLSVPEFGFVRSIAPTDVVVVARTTEDWIDVNDLLVIRSPDGERPSVVVRVLAVGEKDARVGQVLDKKDDAIAHGDPVEFRAVERSPTPT